MDKTFSQEELDAILKERLSRQQNKFQREIDELKQQAGGNLQNQTQEAVSSTTENIEKVVSPETLLKKQTSDLKVEKVVEPESMTELEKLKSKLAEMENAEALRQKESLLNEAGLPSELASRLQGSSIDEWSHDIVNLRAILPPPIIGQPASPANIDSPKVFTRETLASMKPEEINANWAQICAQLKNPI